MPPCENLLPPDAVYEGRKPGNLATEFRGDFDSLGCAPCVPVPTCCLFQTKLLSNSQDFRFPAHAMTDNVEDRTQEMRRRVHSKLEDIQADQTAEDITERKQRMSSLEKSMSL